MQDETRDLYPKTAACDRYLKMRQQHHDMSSSRCYWEVGAFLLGGSNMMNLQNHEALHAMQFAYHDCQMTTLNLFFKQSKNEKTQVSEHKTPSSIP